MKAKQAKSKHSAKGLTCRACRNRVTAGQWFIEMAMPNNPITDRHFTLHVKCIREAIEDTPEDTDKAKETFDNLRDKILTTGQAFPN